MSDAVLVCPRCGAAHGGEDRFCRRCSMPLVHADRRALTVPVSETHERARKVKPQYAEGDLVMVAGARHQPEAELIQGLLLEEGIPSLLRRTRGFDVPEMLAAGPRDVLVPASGLAVAREVLLQEGFLDDGVGRHHDRPARVLAALVAGVALVALVVWLGSELIAV